MISTFLRHRLLRQPGGFEGVRKVGASTELFEADEFSIAELPRDEERVADPGVAARHRPRNTPHGDDLVASVIKTVDLLKRTGQDLPLLSHYGDDFVVPSPRARLNGRGGIDVLALRMNQGEDGFGVLPVPSIHQATNDLHVLLRHRLRSISRRVSGLRGDLGVALVSGRHDLELVLCRRRVGVAGLVGGDHLELVLAVIKALDLAAARCRA